MVLYLMVLADPNTQQELHGAFLYHMKSMLLSQGFGTEWFWKMWKNGNPAFVEFMKKNYPPDFTYADFAPMFTAEFFEPEKWASIFKASGAKYVVLTTKHHEGFTNWPSKVSFNWNSMDVGPERDLVGDFTAAVRNKTDLRVGFYHSLCEWFNPLILEDIKNNLTTQYFVKSKTMPELYELVNTYKPDIIWSDGDFMGNQYYYNSTQFVAWLYNDSPVKDEVVTNDRWGKSVHCKHGGFLTCKDKYNPGVLQKKKWENAMTIDKNSWGYRRNLRLNQLLSIEELIKTLVETVSCGGNILINVGPTKEGTIIPIFEERLRQLGSWLKVNGDAIYASKPWSYQNDTFTPGVWYTSKEVGTSKTVYAILLSWPEDNILTLGAPITTPKTTVTMLGYKPPLKWAAKTSAGIMITIPNISINKMPCLWAWVLKFENLIN
ncbi:hypothetical protein ScPMuIL_005004 [Solemya velum]